MHSATISNAQRTIGCHPTPDRILDYWLDEWARWCEGQTGAPDSYPPEASYLFDGPIAFETMLTADVERRILAIDAVIDGLGDDQRYAVAAVHCLGEDPKRHAAVYPATRVRIVTDLRRRNVELL
jgi:hypothetical protein